MERATPVQMRQSLEIVNAFRVAGIRFVPVPAASDVDYAIKIQQVLNMLDELEKHLSK